MNQTDNILAKIREELRIESIINEELYLAEVGEANTVPYEFIVDDRSDNDIVTYFFVTEDKDKYEVAFNKITTSPFHHHNIWNLLFGVLYMDNGKYSGYADHEKVVNKGRLFRVMTTISSIVKVFVADTRPTGLIIQPTKTKSWEDNRRLNLYLAYLKRELNNYPNYVLFSDNDEYILIMLKGLDHEDMLAFYYDVKRKNAETLSTFLDFAEVSLEEYLDKYTFKRN